MAYTPEPSPNLATKRDAENRVRDLPRGNFMLAYHPDEWQLDARGRLIPTVVHLSKEVGHGAVAADGDFTPAEIEYKRRGYQLIPHDILGDIDYVALYRNRKGKKVHRSIFQEPYDTANGVTEWTFDQEAWDRFISLLRKRNFIKAPRPKIVEGLLRQTEEAYDGLLRREPSRDQAEKHEAWQKKVDLIRSQVRTLKAELEASYETYGRPASRARSALAAQLAALETTGDEDVDAVLRRTLDARAAAAESVDEKDDAPEIDDDEDLDLSLANATLPEPPAPPSAAPKGRRRKLEEADE
jgi:hypothetical protein